MPITLKGKVLEMVDTLQKARKFHLAQAIEKNWHKSALAYSKELNLWRPKKPIEPELLGAFAEELTRLETPSAHKKDILTSIKKRRILQTAPHLGATESPRMLCINWLGSLGVPDDQYYVVGMFSGIPFSNRSRPGRINRKEDSVNLFPSTMQDALVYRSRIPNKLLESVEKLPENIKRYLPQAIAQESYTKWAVMACQHTERQILNKNNLVYLDLGEVMTYYLLAVLKNKTHVMHKIFFNPKWRAELEQTFPEEIMFYSSVTDGKYEQMESLVLRGNKLTSKNKEILLDNPQTLIKELEAGHLCAGLLPSFLILAFLNDFKCFGSFAQVEYLPVYQDKLSKISFFKKMNFEKTPTVNLSTGVFNEKENLYPADIITEGKKFKPKSSTRLGELLLPMKNILLESYLTGVLRKK